jgi:hypothetical protein
MKLPLDLIFREPMPSKAFKLLVFLFSVSTTGGECVVSNAALRAAVRDSPMDNGSVHTINACIAILKRLDWISHELPRRPRRIYIRTPRRFLPAVMPKNEDRPDKLKIVPFG